MTQYNNVNVYLSDPKLNKLKPSTKNETGMTLRLSLNTIVNSIDETINFPQQIDKLQIFIKFLQIIH